MLFLFISPLIYGLVALTLSSVPYTPSPKKESLDFNKLKIQDSTYSHSPSLEKDYLTRNQSKLFYRLIEGKSDISIVLLHGSGSEGRYLIPLAQKLNTLSNYNIIVPDLRGHGFSTNSNPGDIDYLRQFEDDLEDLLVHIKTTYKTKNVILGGHSSGGGLVIKYAGNDLKNYDASILLSPYLHYKAPTVRKNSGGWVEVASARYAGLSMLNFVGLTFMNSNPVLFFNRPLNLRDSLQVESYSYTLNESLSPHNYEEDLLNNKSPIILIVGKNDEAFYSDQFKPIFNEFAPHTDFHLLEDTKHLDVVSNKKTATLIDEWTKHHFQINK